MKVMPAIDLKYGGKIVIGPRQRRLGTAGIPRDFASEWRSEGAEYIQVFNLDLRDYGLSFDPAAMGQQKEWIEKSKRACEEIGGTGVPLMLGGGLRDTEEIGYAAAVADRVIVGYKLLDNESLLKEVSAMVGPERLVMAFDWDRGSATTESGTFYSMFTKADKINDLVGAYLVSSLEREGTLKGLDIKFYRMVCEEMEKPIIATGGTSSLDDVKRVRDTGAWGLVIGRALYEGRFFLHEAIDVAGQ